MTYPGVILKAWNLHAKKQLGQNFLSDPQTAEMIVRRSGISKEDIVVEIGAGLGAMTIPLAMTAKKIYAIEKNRQLIPLLNAEILSNATEKNNVEIINKKFILSKIDKNFYKNDMYVVLNNMILKNEKYLNNNVLIIQSNDKNILISFFERNSLKY